MSTISPINNYNSFIPSVSKSNSIKNTQPVGNSNNGISDKVSISSNAFDINKFGNLTIEKTMKLPSGNRGVFLSDGSIHLTISNEDKMDIYGLDVLPENKKQIEKLEKQLHKAETVEEQGAISSDIKYLEENGWKKPMTLENVRQATDEFEYNLHNDFLFLVDNFPNFVSKITLEIDPAKINKNKNDFDKLDEFIKNDTSLLEYIKNRWQENGLNMPTGYPDIRIKNYAKTGEMWLDMAVDAGFSKDEFLSKAREFAQNADGNELTQKIEKMISDRYKQK